MQKFKVGDKVKVVKNTHLGWWDVDHSELLTVEANEHESHDNTITVAGKTPHHEYLIQWYDESDLELIQAVKE